LKNGVEGNKEPPGLGCRKRKAKVRVGGKKKSGWRRKNGSRAQWGASALIPTDRRGENRGVRTGEQT